MKLHKNIWLLILFYVVNVRGQDNKDLSIQEAITLALNENRSLQLANFDRQIAQKAKWETISNYLPKVNLEASLLDNLQLNTVLLPGIMFGRPGQYIPVQFGVEYQTSWAIKAQQVLLSAPLIVGIKMAEESKKLSELGYLKTENEVIGSVKTFYTSALVLQRSTSIIENNIKNLESIYDKTKTMYNLGMVQSTDVDQLEITITNLKNTKHNLERNLELTMNLLRFNLGLDTSQKIVLTTTLEDLINEQELLSLLSTPYSIDMSNDFQIIKVQEKIAKLNVDKEKADILPSIAGFYNYTKTGQANELNNFKLVSIESNWTYFKYTYFCRNTKLYSVQ